MNNYIIIPARLNSSRLPNKILLDLQGKSVIQRVYEQCRKVKGIKGVIIAVDSLKVLEHCKKFTSDVFMTDINHQSGTDRIAEVNSRIKADIIVNVQGDEPFISPLLIEDILAAFDKNTNMVSAMHKICTVSELLNPNVVKVVVDKNNYAMYFSRSVIPLDRDNREEIFNKKKISASPYYRHLGIYGYKSRFLKEFASWPQTPLEQLEKLEQLRVIENGYKIKMVKSLKESLGIDTVEDYNKALTYFTQ
ncbi:3-deoxy-manno-octulosonate cytidylyltransferase [Leeuwenhoekiella sp. A16]|uniref:3-deoxy-manno-octulosonate cytidylyltransferase n=1 Tax=unclassified Leeuwenhoekiella TaxID=2615029 RepID=UPI003A80B6E1